MNLNALVEQLKKDEGFSPVSWWDREQFTFGYGCKAPGPDATITKEQALPMLEARAQAAIDDVYDIYAGVALDEVRALALGNLAFNIGETKLRKFNKMNAAIRAGDWGTAAYEAFDSSWRKQLSKPGLKSIERAERIVWELLTGEKG